MIRLCSCSQGWSTSPRSPNPPSAIVKAVIILAIGRTAMTRGYLFYEV